MKFDELFLFLVWTLFGAALIYAATQFRYEWVIGEQMIPLTGQSFAVLVVGYCWPRWSGVMAVLLYLLVGGFGLPVFADGASGWEVFQGSSGGYLLGFFAAAWYLRGARYRGWTKGFFGKIGLMSLASIFILGFGFIRLAQMFGTEVAIDSGFYPLWLPAVIKLVIAAVIAHLVGILSLQPWKR